MGKNTDRPGKILRIVFTGILLAVLAVCIYVIYPKLREYRESDRAYKKIRTSALKKRPEDGIRPEAETETFRLTDTDTDTLDSQKETEDEDILYIDWDEFAGSDIVAWLVLDDISYPVLYSGDNEKYLHHLPDGTYNYGGSLFLHKKNSPLFNGEVSFIFGHNMANGSMFGKLSRYKDPEYKDHVFYLYRPDGTRNTYRFFSVLSIPESSKAYTYTFGGEESFMEWQNQVMKGSLYPCSCLPDVDARYVLLSTCNGPTGTSQRLLVAGLLEESEQVQPKASWYDEFEDQSLLSFPAYYDPDLMEDPVDWQ